MMRPRSAGPNATAGRGARPARPVLGPADVPLPAELDRRDLDLLLVAQRLPRPQPELSKIQHSHDLQGIYLPRAGIGAGSVARCPFGGVTINATAARITAPAT